MQRVQTGEPFDHALAEPGLADKRGVFGAFTHVEASQEILVFHGNRIAVLVGFKILQISLYHGMLVAHLSHEEVLSLDSAVDDIIERSRRRSRWSFCGWCGGRRCGRSRMGSRGRLFGRWRILRHRGQRADQEQKQRKQTYLKNAHKPFREQLKRSEK